MPFDAFPEGLTDDLVKLRTALNGVRTGWTEGSIGKGEADHCAIGWLLVATDWDRDEAVRLALEYVYPALPQKARKPHRKITSIYVYNDDHSQRTIEKLFINAVRL